MRTTTTTSLLSAAAAALIGLAGCAATIEPPARPQVGVPARWSVATPPAQARDDAWWHDFGSPELDAYVATALQANPDVRATAARVQQARSLLGGAEADRRPQLGLEAGASRGRQTTADAHSEALSVGLRARWEADLFGAKGLAVTAATSDAESAALALSATQVALAADVATAYFEAHVLARREAAADESISALEQQLKAVRLRFAAGQLTRLDIDRLEAELAQERGNRLQLQGARQARLRQLGLLLGAPQQATPQYADAQAWKAAPPPTLLPAELLERRPDVQREARALDAAAARLGIARRDLYPRLAVEWAGRRERLAVEGASMAPATVVAYGVSLMLPLFDGGRIRANIAVHEARTQEAMAVYEKALLAALADAETALLQWQSAESTLPEMQRALDAATQAEQRSQRLFDAGLVTVDTVLDVRRSRLRAQDGLLQAQGARWAASIGVRRAFAGGVPRPA
jgi:multidrug efflux system outer membrane protein